MQEFYNYQPRDVLADTQVTQNEDSLLLSIPSQLLYGFLEGMTTLPVARWAGDEPNSTTEQIANSLGSLMGFVGINPVGVAGKVASKLFVKGTMGKYLGALSKNTRMPSLPMYLGNKIAGKINQIGLTPALEAMEFTRKNPILKDMAFQAVTLGAQMGVGGAPIYDWSLGAMEDRMKSGVMGALFGAGNSLIGNTFTRGGKFDMNPFKDEDIKLLMKSDKQAATEAIKASDFRNGLVRAGISGAVFSLPSLLEGAPLPIVLYDTALNAFFGYKESPYWMKQAKAISEQFIESPHLLLNPKDAVNDYKEGGLWDRLDTRVKDTLTEMADLQLGGLVKNAFDENVSVPGMKVGEVLREFYKTAKVIPNDQIPKEGEINKQDHDMLTKKYFIQDLHDKAFEDLTKQNKTPDTEAVIEYIRQGLYEHARNTLGTDTRLGTMEMFRRLEEMDGFIGAGLTNESQYQIDQAYKENGLSGMFTQSLDGLVKKTFGTETTTEEMFTDRYKEIIGIVSKYTKDKSLGYIDFENELTTKYGITPDNSFRSAYVTANQSVPRLEVTLGENGEIRLISNLNEKNQVRPVSYEPKPLIYDMLDGDIYEFATTNDFKALHDSEEVVGGFATGKGFKDDVNGHTAYLLHNLYNTKMNREGAETTNLAFYSGHKDQSKYLVGKFLITPEQAKEVIKLRSPLQFEEKKGVFKSLEQIYNDGLKRFVESGSPGMKDELTQVYEHSFANNIAFIEKFHNRSLVEIADANGQISKSTQKAWMLEPFSLMKRTQGLNSRQIRFNALDVAEELYYPKEIATETAQEAPGTTKSPKPPIDTAVRKQQREEAAKRLGNQRYIILNAINVDAEGKPTGSNTHVEDLVREADYKFKTNSGMIPYDAHLDGGSIVRSDIFEAQLRSIGELPVKNGVEMGSMKGINIHQGDENGSGTFSKKARFKATPELDDFMRKYDIHEIEYNTTMKVSGDRKGQNYMVKDKQIIMDTPKVYERPWDSGTYLMPDETVKINKPHRAMKQLFTNIGGESPEGIAAQRAVLDFVREKIQGKKYNEVIGVDANGKEQVRDKISYSVGKLREGDLTVDDFLYEALNKEEIGLVDRLMIFLSNRDSKSWRFIKNEILNTQPDNEWKENDESEFEYFKDYGLMNKLFKGLKNGTDDGITPAILASVNSARNYVQTALKRYIMNELIKPKIRDSMTSTLTPQLPYVDKHIGRGEIYYGREAKKQIYDFRTGETLEKAFIRLGDKLEITVIRAPADSPSGIRVLKFKGFIDAPGNGAYVHPDEYYNLGGADNDIDKITSYFQLPKEVQDYYKTKKNQWYDKDGVAIPPKDNPEYLDPQYKDYTISPFDPVSNAVVNRNAYKGISILGAGLNHTNRMLAIHDWISQKKGGKAVISLYAPNTPENMQYFKYLQKLNKKSGFIEWGSELYSPESSDGTKIAIKFPTRLADKKIISKHQRDIVNYAADASNGEPVMSVFAIKELVNRDMWQYPFDAKGIKGLKVYGDYSKTLYDRLDALDSLYSDNNKFIKEVLPNGREKNTRYNIEQIFKVAEDWYEVTHDLNDTDVLGGVDSYMYRVFEMMGERASEYRNMDGKNAYNWIGNASAIRKLASQFNDFADSEAGKLIFNYYMGRSKFGLAFFDSEYHERALKGMTTAEELRAKRAEDAKYHGMSYVERMEAKMDEMINEADKQVEAAMSGGKIVYEKYKPDFEKDVNSFVYNSMLSDFRANDVMDMASLWHISSKGKIALDKYGNDKVRPIINDMQKLLVKYANVRSEKQKGNKTIENEWVLETMDYFKSIKEPELKALAEAYLISSIPVQKNTLKSAVRKSFGELIELLKDVPDEVLSRTIENERTGKYDPETAYNFVSKHSSSELKKFADAYEGNSNAMYKALLKLKETGREYFSSNFNDAIARLPFISEASIVDLFRTYQTIIDFSNQNVDTVLKTMEETRQYIEQNVTGNDINNVIPPVRSYLKDTFTAEQKVKELDIYDSLQSRIRTVLKRLPHLATRLEGEFFQWQQDNGIDIPKTFKDVTLPQLQRFVDHIESETVTSSYSISTKDWYKTPQSIGKTMNFYDRKTNQVIMRIAEGREVKTVKVDIPSSRVNNSILIGDYIQNARGAEYKYIDKLVDSDGDEELVFEKWKTDENGDYILNELNQRVKEADVIVINPNFIKAQIGYDDFATIQEYAIASHEAKILKYQQNPDAYHEYLRTTFKKAAEAYRFVKRKEYNITFNKKTKRMYGEELVTEIENFFKAFNQKGISILNDTFTYQRLFKQKYEDPELGFGIKGFEDERIIRITDLAERMSDEFASGRGEKYTQMGLNVQQLIGWNVDVYHKRFKYGDNDYRTIEKYLYDTQKITSGDKNFWYYYGKEFKRLKEMIDSEGKAIHPILSNPPKEKFDMPKGFRESYFPHMDHTESAVRERMELVLKKSAPNSEEFRKAQLWMINKGKMDFADVEESLKDSLFNKSDDKAYARISASVSKHLKARNGDFFIPGYKRDFRVYNDYLKSLKKQVYDTLLVAIHKHNMSRMEKESITKQNRLTPLDAKKMRMFMDIRMLDILGYPSQFPDKYVDALQLEGTFYHKLTNDYWIRRKSPFIDKVLGIPADTPDEYRARRINSKIASLSNLEATWAMMPLLASPKFMITNRFSGGMTTIVNSSAEYFLKAHKLSEVNKYVNKIKSYSDMVDFVSEYGGIESFIKNELVLSQNVKLGDVTAFVKDVMQVYKEGKDMPLTRMYEIAKQRGLTQEFVDKAAYFMRASEIKNRVYAWFAHYMKAHDLLFKSKYKNVDKGATLEGDPWLVAMANKGVAATQYLYDSLNRPAFARTSLGKMLTRFQLFTYNNIQWRKQLMDAARYEDWNSANGKRLGNLMAMDMMVLTLATFFPGTMFSAALNQPYGWVRDLSQWLFGDEEKREKAFFGSMPYPANIVQPLLPPFTRFLINPIVALFDLEKFSNTLVWSMFPFGRMVNETRKSIENPLLMPEKSFGIPLFTLVRKIQADYKRRDKQEQEENPPVPE